MSETADEDLTALLDGQLAEAEQGEVLRRLAADPSLQRRLHALAQTRGPLDAAFGAMLANAPVARLRAALPGTRPSTFGRGRMAASFIVVALLGAALGAWLIVNARNSREDWVTTVAEYMQLYTSETFAGLAPDAPQQAAIVGKVGARFGVVATPSDLAPPGFAFKTAFVLSYNGVALGEFVFVDAAGAPYLFCILAQGAEPGAARTENRQGFMVTTWGRRDERFLVIGRSTEIIRNWSRTLEGRV